MSIVLTPSEGLACGVDATTDACCGRPSRHASAAGRFSEGERRLLLSETGIGHGVVERLEAAGFNSFDQLRQAGIGAVVMAICTSLRSRAWANRRRALERAVARDAGRRSGGPTAASSRAAAYQPAGSSR